jgi:hypothetical protein
MTAELVLEINKRFKKSIAKDPNVLTCIVTGKSRPTNSQYLEEKAVKAGSKERFIKYYISREALTLLKSGMSVDGVRDELGVIDDHPRPNQNDLVEALKINGK